MTITRGLVIVYTGDGKGKTTAALGLALRAHGQGLRVCVIQFIKDERGRWGERMATERLGWEWHTLGSGFVWDPAHQEEAHRRALAAWQLAQERIANGAFDLVVLDEFTYPLAFGWLEVDATLAWFAEHRPPTLHLVITGRGAPEALIAAADCVTEMRCVKHPYDAGIAAQKGIEF